MAGFKDAEDYVRYTAIRGTFVHFNILNDLSFSPLDPSGLPPTPEWWPRKDTLLPEIEHCRNLWNQSNPLGTFRGNLIIETPLYHPSKHYAGTPDLIVPEQGLVIDLKTSSRPKEEHKTQLGAYAQMIEIHKITKIRKAVLVYLNPKMSRTQIVEIGREELNNEIDIFNEKLSEFWRIPGIQMEYGT
jgi:hypothetical protein